MKCMFIVFTDNDDGGGVEHCLKLHLQLPYEVAVVGRAAV